MSSSQIRQRCHNLIKPVSNESLWTFLKIWITRARLCILQVSSTVKHRSWLNVKKLFPLRHIPFSLAERLPNRIHKSLNILSCFVVSTTKPQPSLSSFNQPLQSAHHPVSKLPHRLRQHSKCLLRLRRFHNPRSIHGHVISQPFFRVHIRQHIPHSIHSSELFPKMQFSNHILNHFLRFWGSRADPFLSSFCTGFGFGSIGS